MCLYLYTESVVCTCTHVHLHAQEPVDVNACVCTACGPQRLVRDISLNICPHSVLGQGISLIWNSPVWMDWLPSQPQRSSCVYLHELKFQACAKHGAFIQLLGTVGNMNSVSYAWAASASQAEPCLQPFNAVFCMENGLVAATIETMSGKWGLRVAAKNNSRLSCWDSMAKLFKIWPLGPTEPKEREFLAIITYSGTSICNFLQMKSGVKNAIEKKDSWRTQRMSTLRSFALYSA